MRPAEVLDHQAALLDYLTTGAYAGYMEGFINDMIEKGAFSASGGGHGRWIVDTMRNSLRIAQAFHVQAEMMPLLRTAAADLESTDYLVHDRLPAEHGFLLFDDGWTAREVWGRDIVVSGFQWWHGGAEDRLGGHVPGVWITTYTDIRDERDQTNAEVLASHPDSVSILGRWHVQHVQFIPYEQRVGPSELRDDEYRAMLRRDHHQHTDGVSEPYTGPLPNGRRMIVALFRLLGQVLVDVKDAPIDRATGRRAKRANLPQRVQTIALRRKETRYLNPGDHESGRVEWQHQWPVRGHWAWRHCGAEHPEAEPYEKGHRVRVYVAPYWKGPEGKPIRLTEKVWDLSR